MARQIEWTEHALSDYVDHVGQLGPFKAFTVQLDGVSWVLTSHFIPSKYRGKRFPSEEAAKQVAQKIVDDFARWLNG